MNVGACKVTDGVGARGGDSGDKSFSIPRGNLRTILVRIFIANYFS